MKLKTAYRIWMGCLLGGLALFLLFLLIPLYELFYAGLAVWAGGFIFWLIRGRCPNCGRILGSIRGDFCPRCGEKLFEEDAK